MESKAQLIGRIARQCLGFLEALLVSFGTIGLAHYGYPVELYDSREDACRNHEASEREDTSQRQKEESLQSGHERSDLMRR